MEVHHAARKAQVAGAGTASEAGKVSSGRGHQTPEANADAARALTAVQLYDLPQLNSSQFTDPAAAGGYSNAIANNSRELVREYLHFWIAERSESTDAAESFAPAGKPITTRPIRAATIARRIATRTPKLFDDASRAGKDRMWVPN
jgi:hypothetical protein